MTNFTLATGSQKAVWGNEFMVEYVRTNPFMPYMGSAKTSIIRVLQDLGKQAGDTIHVPMVSRLRGAGVQGTATLFGNEDTMSNYSDRVTVALNRNAVGILEDASFRTELDLFGAARDDLVQWCAEKLRDDVIAQLNAVIVKAGVSGTSEDIAVTLAAATAAQKDLHLDSNVDRVLFGNANSNISTTSPQGGATRSFSNSLLNVTSGMTMSAAIVDRAKTIAKKAGAAAGTAHIRPFKSDMTQGREYYVLFVNSEQYRDLSNDSVIINANTQAREREGDGLDKNPLFQGGDLLYHGVIIREVPELGNLGTVGASGATVAAASLCGQSAVGVAWASKPEPRRQAWDFDNYQGIGIREIRGQKKLSFNGSQYGVVNIFTAATPDS